MYKSKSWRFRLVLVDLRSGTYDVYCSAVLLWRHNKPKQTKRKNVKFEKFKVKVWKLKQNELPILVRTFKIVVNMFVPSVTIIETSFFAHFMLENGGHLCDNCFVRISR